MDSSALKSKSDAPRALRRHRGGTVAEPWRNRDRAVAELERHLTAPLHAIAYAAAVV